MEFFNSKQRKEFFTHLSTLYGYTGPTDIVLFTGGKDKIYTVSRDIEKLPFEKIYIKQGGLYIGESIGEGIRLSMDGAMYFGKYCSAIVSLDQPQRDEWMRGNDMGVDAKDGWKIVMYEDDILGCGRVKEGNLLNYVPKGRRIHDPH